MARAVPPVEQVASGLWSIPVPMVDNPLGYTLVYLVESRGAPLLVDAGWDDGPAWSALVEGVAATGHELSDLAGVVATHFHPDHLGLAGRVRETAGCWVAMHREDARMVQFMARELGRSSTGRGRPMEMILRAAGVDRTDLEQMAGNEEWRSLAPLAQPDHLLDDGDLVDVPGRLLRVVWTPGHTPGHVCLHLEEERLLLTGDHVLPGITPHVGLYQEHGDPLGDFLDSLQRLVRLDAEHILPAHEHRFLNLPQRVDEILLHHQDRLSELESLLAAGPLTQWECAERLSWNRPWAEIPSSMRRAALGETAAHVRRLERLGRAARMPGGLPVRFGLAGEGRGAAPVRSPGSGQHRGSQPFKHAADGGTPADPYGG